MIISCEKCETKYRLDESKLSYSSVKVQCSKCDHIFIVTAVDDDKKKSGIRDKKPAKTGIVPDEKVTPDKESPFDSTPEIAKDKTPDEPKERADEKDEDQSTPKEGSDDIDDFSFEGDITRPIESDDNKTNVSGPGKATSEGEKTTTVERGSEPIPRQSTAHEPSHITAERDEPKGEENREAPLPWEVSSNSFDLSFGTKEYKPRYEDEPNHIDENSPEEKDTPLSPEPEAGDTGSAENIINEDDEGDESAILSEIEFELKDLLKEAGKASGGSVDTAEEGGGDEASLSFNENNVKTAPTDTMTFDNESTKKEAVTPNHTFSIPDTPTEPEETKKTGITGIIAIIVIIIAISGALIYMKTRPESAMMAEPSGASPLEIEATKGYYVVNKDGGRIFVIETMLKNITDGPVKISGIRGLVMDSSGKEMARKIVSPGRVVTDEDIRNLPVETLLKSFRDTSAGTMPKKSTIPTMILFTDLQKAVAEYGIDVLR
jgi:predicted Zn finger-like uncharacterized protein